MSHPPSCLLSKLTTIPHFSSSPAVIGHYQSCHRPSRAHRRRWKPHHHRFSTTSASSHWYSEPHHPPCCSTRRRGSVGSRASHRFTPGRPGLRRRLCHRVRLVRGDHACTCRAPFWRGPGMRHFDVGRPGCLWPWVGPPCPGLHDISANDSLWAATPRAALGQITAQHHFNLFRFCLNILVIHRKLKKMQIKFCWNPCE
jgi:hypothetical protein